MTDQIPTPPQPFNHPPLPPRYLPIQQNIRISKHARIEQPRPLRREEVPILLSQQLGQSGERARALGVQGFDVEDAGGGCVLEEFGFGGGAEGVR